MRQPLFRRTLVALLGLWALLSACVDDREALADAVRRYCLLLAQGYSSLDMSALPHVATTEETARLQHHMAALADAQLRMESKLLSFDCQTITAEGRDSAMATTSEEWEYRYLDLERAKVIQENTIHYQARYYLTQKDNRWLVSSVDILNAKEGKALPPLPFFQRPEKKSDTTSVSERP